MPEEDLERSNLIRYYHDWLTCPSCHSPHNEAIGDSSSRIRFDSRGDAVCSNCTCVFKHSIDTKTSNQLIAHPLYWPINFNPIENAYLEWIQSIPHGKYLITWPWRNVKFSPLIAAEFARVDGGSGPIIIYSQNVARLPLKLDQSQISRPSPCSNLLWKCLIRVTDPSTVKGDLQKNIFKQINKISKVHTFTIHEFKPASGPSFELVGDYSDFMVPINSKKISSWDTTRKNPLLYEKYAFTDVEQAIRDDRCQRISSIGLKQYDILALRDVPEDKIVDRSIAFIRSSSRGQDEIQPSREFLKIFAELPRLVIIENLEMFLHRFRRNDFFGFLESLPKDCLILMFSTNENLRYMQMMDIRKRQDIITHSWDTPDRIEYLKRSGFCGSKYPSPATSIPSEIRRNRESPDRKDPLIRTESIEAELSRFFDPIDQFISDEHKKYGQYSSNLKETIRYLSHAKRTPLPLNTSDTNGFARWSRFGGEFLNIFQFINKIKEINESTPIIELIKDLAINCEFVHPVYTGIKRILAQERNHRLLIIVHKHDRRKFDFMLNPSGKSSSIIVLDWEHLPRFLSDSNGVVDLVIVEPMQAGDLADFKKINEIWLVGRDADMELIDKEIKIIANSSSAPSFLKPGEQAPALLIAIEQALKDVEVKKEISLPSLTEISTSNISLLELLSYDNDSFSSESSAQTKEYRPEECIVFSNSVGKCVIFPPGSQIAWKGSSDGGILPASEMFRRDLKDVAIFLSQQEMPLKVRFADWIMNEIPERKHVARGFIWESMEELIFDSIEWIEELRAKALDIGDEELARKIRESGTTAQDEDYIRKWWREYELPPIRSSSGRTIQVPSIERPQNLDDLRKIADLTGKGVFQDRVERIWVSVLEIQRMRNTILNMSKRFNVTEESQGNIEPELEILIDEFAQDFQPFEVNLIQKIPYSEDLPLYKIISCGLIQKE